MNINGKLLLSAAIALASGSAYATTFSGIGDPISDPALTGGTMETFDAGPAGESASVTLGNVTYIGSDGTFTIGTDFIGQYNTRGVYSIYNGGDYIPANFRFEFATPVQAFAFNWGAADDPWTLNAYDSNDVLLDSFVLTPTQGSNNGEYFGIAATNISYATLVASSTGDWVFIDNFTTTGEAVPVAPLVPVPTLSQTMLALMTLLLAGFGYRRLRRRT